MEARAAATPSAEKLRSLMEEMRAPMATEAIASSAEPSGTLFRRQNSSPAVKMGSHALMTCVKPTDMRLSDIFVQMVPPT